ncbi:MAG: glycosyltransferase family 4 protein [Chloroflexi bacterium]|nr:glycosyltransferase family 4 protein [Chloroflexota bacterium]
MTTAPKPYIAILHYAAPPTIGGVESTIATHARLLIEHGYAVKIIAGRAEQFDPRIPVQIIPLLDSRHSFVSEVNQKLNRGIIPSDFLPLTTAIRHTLQEALIDVDVCIAHNIPTLHKNLALTNALHELTQMGKPRFIAWCHDFAWEDPVYANDVHNGLPWDLLRQAWQGVQYVVVSDTRRGELANLLRIPMTQIAVVPPGVDALEFLGATETTARRIRELHLLDAAPLCLLPARVTRRKNIELAIAITAAVWERGFAPKLVVMGPLGPHNPANISYLDELRGLQTKLGVQGHVIFLQEHGAVDDASRRDLYQLADLLLFPSAREGFGIPILEAGLMHLPIFCSDIPPFRESAREWGHYFALDESPATIAEQLVDFLDRDARYQMKQHVLREYAWEQIFAESIEPLIASTQQT